MLTPLIGAAAWLSVGGLVLFARSRGWTLEFERRHPVGSTVALVIVAWSVAGWLVFAGVLGLVGVVAVSSSVPRLVRYAILATVVAVAGWTMGRFSVASARPRSGLCAVLIVAPALLQLLVNGPGAALVATLYGCVAVVAFTTGRRFCAGGASASNH